MTKSNFDYVLGQSQFLKDIGIAYKQFSFDVNKNHHMYTHDFHEMMFVYEGSFIHLANNKTQRINKGDVILIRPTDQHMLIENTKNTSGKLINLPFSDEILHEFSNFLELNKFIDVLLKKKNPPMITLSESATNSTIDTLSKVNFFKEENYLAKRIQLKQVLLTLFLEFYTKHISGDKKDIPQWFINLCNEMNHKENFVEGPDALTRISKKSYQHIAKLIRYYYDKSPSEYVNDMRLSYSLNLLQNTDIKITQISYDSGFKNLSHFHKLFKQKYSYTPAECRELFGLRSTSIK